MNSVGLRPVAPLAIIVAALAEIRAAAATHASLDASLVAAIDDVERLARGLEPYVEACTSPASPALLQLASDTQREDWDARFERGETAVRLEGEMLSGHLEGQFLKTLVHAMKATRVLEIGVFTGYSALAMAEALPPGGELLACELDAFAAAFARRAFDASPHGAKIRLEIGDAETAMRRLARAGDSFDLIFIDADKAKYPTYFELALGGTLLAPGGLIAIDNTLMQGQPYLGNEPTPNGRAIAAFNRLVSDDPRVEQVLLPIRDGLTLVRRV